MERIIYAGCFRLFLGFIFSIDKLCVVLNGGEWHLLYNVITLHYKSGDGL